jgi:hypothetical protein
MPLKAVSLLLGHANNKVTEKHYAKFTLDQQRQLEDLTRQAWAAQAPKLEALARKNGCEQESAKGGDSDVFRGRVYRKLQDGS